MTEFSVNEAMAPLNDLVPTMGSAPIAPAHGIAAIALSMAMKYHDIGTVQDGTLYQQYKLEGRNLTPLHLDMVLETAERMELWLMGSSERIAKVLVDAISAVVDEDENAPEAKPASEPT